MSEPAFIYKILSATEWQAAQEAGVYQGSADDTRDGFIHFSTADQVDGTRAKYFAGRADLVLLEVDGASLGTALRYERARGDALFPHLYGVLPLSSVRKVTSL
jgi:uncharacterized protein (DUF952 family)